MTNLTEQWENGELEPNQRYYIITKDNMERVDKFIPSQQYPNNWAIN